MNPPGFNENSCANNKEPEFGSQILDPERYKTELCRTFERDGFCGYGAKCQFAHSNRELRSPSRNSKYKTEPCRAFHIIGYCPYGTRCQYVHRASADNGASSPSSSRASNAKKSSSPPLSHAEMAERYGLATRSCCGLPSARTHCGTPQTWSTCPRPGTATAATAAASTWAR
uniref:mRNA decay activator protein ZFP36 n=1 Tax=Neogobius melanostomus TaxID=47308 RepID=A0A8C6T6W6_9GOBI